MTYKTVVLPYQPRAEKMAASVEEKANEMAASSQPSRAISFAFSSTDAAIFSALG